MNITGNPSGDYCLTIQIDPKGRLLETDERDNTVSSLVRIDVERSRVTVLNPTSCSTGTTVTGISPATGRVGTTEEVTITGTGFAPGMSVGFEGGSGPAPAVRILSIDSTTIRATVTVKKGRPGKDPVWDLRVGSELVLGAFTVRP